MRYVALVGSLALVLEGDHNGEPFAFEDGGGNSCGCSAVDGICKLVSAGLDPPTALEASE